MQPGPMLPSLFVSHGAPTLALDPVPCHAFLRGLGADLGTPEAVLCVSAHWETAQPRVGAAPEPETIHDFHGFPEALYRLRYPAPGAPGLARRVAALLTGAGFDCALDAGRGLDHGAWVPLMLMFPGAGVPVTQLSIQAGGDGDHHLALGRALAPLRGEGVVVMGSGGATHNLRELGARDDPPAAWARAFDDWLAEAVEDGRADDLAAYIERAPEAARNHPGPDHFMPLLVALGAAGPGARGRRLHSSFTHGTLSMAAFSFA